VGGELVLLGEHLSGDGVRGLREKSAHVIQLHLLAWAESSGRVWGTGLGQCPEEKRWFRELPVYSSEDSYLACLMGLRLAVVLTNSCMVLPSDCVLFLPLWMTAGRVVT